MSNTTLLEFKEQDVTTHCPKKVRECEIVVNLSSKSAIGTVDLPIGEESKVLVCQHIPTRNRKSS